MLIDRNLSRYSCLADESILAALKKISDNKARTVFAVDEHDVLEGVLTDGDFRRWIVDQVDVDLNQPVRQIIQRSYVSVRDGTGVAEIESKFAGGVDYIPIVDGEGHLVAVATARGGEIAIAGRSVGEGQPTFIVAEIGINHNGDLALAKRMIDAAADAGADCAKFQMRSMGALYRNAGDPNDVREDLGAQYTLDLLSRFQLTPEELDEAFDHCRARGLVPLCTPWDEDSVAHLERYGVPAYKIASADLTNHGLIAAIARTGKPILCSTGMSTEEEIKQTVDLFRRSGASFVLLHCNSTYPAPFKDINLNYLERLKSIAGGPVGYSGHERGFAIALAAVAKGAKVIEKHFTFDRTMEGNDHKVSLLPDEFAEMVRGIRAIDEALGSASPRSISQGEMMNRVSLAKSLVAGREIAAGTVIADEMIAVKSPGRGLQPNRRADLVGLVAKRDMSADDFFFPSDLEREQHRGRAYRFDRPWGPPVRYHDFKAILAQTNPDFLEFHLSYKDLQADWRRYIDAEYDLDLVVHSPDLFPGDHLLDLASPDKAYRDRSINELRHVVELTREIAPRFRKAVRPKIVVSVGGFSKDAPKPAAERPALYERVAESLSGIDLSGVELLPQTLPPFPWYFGGQLYLNIFVDRDDTVAFCERHGYRVCLDISHSKLASNHTRTSFIEHVRALGPHTSHIHMGDATGVDGEGLQIGEGEIDFVSLGETLRQVAPKASFIPEIWQGHKNDGEGFWIALERLEGVL
jgi:N-acetylneuraminate synthase